MVCEKPRVFLVVPNLEQTQLGTSQPLQVEMLRDDLGCWADGSADVLPMIEPERTDKHR